MKKATIEDVKQAKEDWYVDPCFDLVDLISFSPDIDFSDYREEFLAFQKECEDEWDEKARKKEKEFQKKAEKIGLGGLLKLMQEHEKLLERHEKAIEYLANNDQESAVRALRGYIS